MLPESEAERAECKKKEKKRKEKSDAANKIRDAERWREDETCENVKGRSEVCRREVYTGVGGCAGDELKDDYEGRREGGEEVLEGIGYGKTRVIMYGMMGCKQAKM